VKLIIVVHLFSTCVQVVLVTIKVQTLPSTQSQIMKESDLKSKLIDDLYDDRIDQLTICQGKNSFICI
jgi:hypothetical protein